MDALNKKDGESLNIVEENIEALKAVLPDAFSEDGIDFEALRQLLGDEVAEGNEKYGLNWHGKKKARQIALTPSTGTLRPCPEESVDWDTTKNLFIEGDNLEVLKLLQKSYAGKVKLIYIDPPYNTGNEFIYPDRYQENLDTYLRYTGQRGVDGFKTTSNSEGSGRYHTNWLNMMLPRLKVARTLLRSDGIIFVSIGDDEEHNLSILMNEVFGEENFCARFIWNTEGNTDNQYKIKVNHEYILAYYKNVEHSNDAVGRVIDPNTPEDSNLRKGYADNNINKNNPENPPSIVELPVGFPSSEESLQYKSKKLDQNFFDVTQNEKFISDEIKSTYGLENKSGLPVKLDDMVVNDYKLTQPCRIYVGMANKNKLLEFIANDCRPVIEDGVPISFYINSNAAVRYRKQNEFPRNILSVLRGMGTTEKSKTYLRRLGVFYDYPKPVNLMKYLVQIGCENKDGLILDFFAGSATMAEAVLELNAEEGKHRKFMMVQLPENLEPTKKEQKAAYEFCLGRRLPANLAEIGKERVRRAAARISRESVSYAGDFGFKVFKLDGSNIRAWNPDVADLEKSLLDHAEHVVEGRSEQDVLYELLLKRGVDLTVPIEERKILGKSVHAIGYGALFACLDTSISKDEIEALGQGIVDWHKELAPEADTQVVFRDSAFADDIAKTNMAAILEQNGIAHVRSL